MYAPSAAKTVCSFPWKFGSTPAREYSLMLITNADVSSFSCSTVYGFFYIIDFLHAILISHAGEC
jgi:hypothetical protein